MLCCVVLCCVVLCCVVLCVWEEGRGETGEGAGEGGVTIKKAQTCLSPGMAPVGLPDTSGV